MSPQPSQDALTRLAELEPGLHLNPPQGMEATARAHLEYARLLQVGDELPHLALAYAERAEALNETPEALATHTELLFEVGMLDEALTAADRLLAVGTDPVAAARASDLRRDILRRGDTMYGLIGAREAVAAWERAAETAEPGEYARELLAACTALAEAEHRRGAESDAATAMLKAVRVAFSEVAVGRDLRTEGAEALARLVGQLVVAERFEEALEWSRRELSTLRDLIREGQQLQSAYARALNNQAVILNNYELHEEAAALIDQALMLQEVLWKADPAEAEPVANSLLTGQTALRGLRRYEDALAWCHRAVAILMKAVNLPRAKIARAHSQLARLLSLTGDPLAPNAFRYVLARYEELEAEHPGRYRTRVAETLNLLIVALDTAGEAPSTRLPLSERLVRLEEELAESGERVTELAQALHNHAVQLADLGRFDEAVEYSARAVALYLGLSEEDMTSSANLANFADTLELHANRLADIDRTAQAVDFSGQALDVYERLLAEDRHLYLPDAARAVENHAAKLEGLGCFDDAAEHSARAVVMLEELVAEGDPAVRRDLATALSNLANRLMRADRVPEAFTTAERALRIRQDQATDGSPELRANLGISLLNLGILFFELGDRGTGVSYSSRSIAVFEDLIGTDREAYLPLLAQALHNHAEHLAKIDRLPEAADCTRRAVELREELAERSDRYRDDLADSLFWAVEYHREADLPERALAYAARREALTRTRAEEDPERLRELAEDGLDLARMHTEAGERGAAVEAARRAVAAARELVATDRPAHVELLECCLSELAQALCLVAPEEAEPFAVECLAVAEELDADDGGYGLAHALDVCAEVVYLNGRYAESLSYSDRALPVWRELAEDGDGDGDADLAACLTTRSPCLAALGRTEDAHAASNEAVILTRAAMKVDRSLRPDFALAAREHALRLHEMGRDGGAAIMVMEAVEHHEILVAQTPNAYRGELARTLLAAARCRPYEARALTEQAVAALEAAEIDEPGAYTVALAEAREALGGLA